MSELDDWRALAAGAVGVLRYLYDRDALPEDTRETAVKLKAEFDRLLWKGKTPGEREKTDA